MSGPNLPELIENVNGELKKWATLFKANKMAVNTQKTKNIIFNTRGKKIAPQGKVVILYNNEPAHSFKNELVTILERIVHNNSAPESRPFKLLGIYFDGHLSFDQHINILTTTKFEIYLSY